MISDESTETVAPNQLAFEGTREPSFEEKSKLLSEETKTKINHTLMFMEAGLNQWEQVKEKGHSPKSFIEGFIHVLHEYDSLRESGTDKRRAQMLTLMKMRSQFVDIALEDMKQTN